MDIEKRKVNKRMQPRNPPLSSVKQTLLRVGNGETREEREGKQPVKASYETVGSN